MKLYAEINPKIDYSRTNLRWDAWGVKDGDFYAKGYIPQILDFIKKQLNLNGNLYEKRHPLGLDSITIPESSLEASDIEQIASIVGKTFVKTDKLERIIHSVGKSYFDVIRVTRNKLNHFADTVCYPASDSEIQRIIELCQKNKIALIPFGGGSSVVGGVEAIFYKKQKGVLSLDTTRLKNLIELDEISKTATFQAGIYGPQLEAILNEKGYTLGHFPQSFEFSTLGGWIAAKGSGQLSGKYGKIEKIVTSLKMVTSKGIAQSLKVPASSTGPDINQIVIGSEGLLGVITEATIKIQVLPTHRKYFAILFPDFEKGVDFIREIQQSTSIKPSMLRLSDVTEADLYETLGHITSGKHQSNFKKSIQQFILGLFGIRNKRVVLIGGFDDKKCKSISKNLRTLKKISRKHTGFYAGTKPGNNWLKNRFNMPYLRNHVMEYGIAIDTLETSTTYERVNKLHEIVLNAIKEVEPNSISMCHVSHSYYEGCSLYFTIIFPIDVKDEIAQWHKIKKAASDAIVKEKAAISHHHGIGVDHQFWYLKQTDEATLSILRSMKTELDPNSILNPGKVFHEL